MIATLVNELNSLDKTAKDTIAWLRKRVEPHGLLVKFECERITEMDEVIGLRRVIISRHNNTTDLSSALTRQCSGLVLEYDDGDWRILSVPAPALARNASVKLINMADYDVYKVTDGTVATAYYYGDMWRFSSANGWDITDYKWIGEQTYGEIIDECLSASCEAGTEFNFNALNPDKSYTFGFSHPAFHFFNRGGPNAWFIHSAIMGDSEVVISRNAEEMGITAQVPIEQPMTLKDIIIALASSRTAPSIVDPCLGFIMRHKEHVVGSEAFANILLESSLLRVARSSIYKLRNTNVTIDHNNRLRYSLLRLFLREGDRTSHARYFPQHALIFDEFASVFAAFSRKVLRACKSATAAKTIAQSKDPADAFASYMARQIRLQGDIQVFSPDAGNLVYDFLLNIQHVDTYYSILIAAPQ